MEKGTMAKKRREEKKNEPERRGKEKVGDEGSGNERDNARTDGEGTKWAVSMTGAWPYRAVATSIYIYNTRHRLIRPLIRSFDDISLLFLYFRAHVARKPRADGSNGFDVGAEVQGKVD